MDDWPIILLVLLVGGFFLWFSAEKTDRAKLASIRLEKDIRLYEHILTGMREYDLRDQNKQFRGEKDRQLLFETARMSAFHVDHLIQSRVGFYFKDINEFGLYGFFVGDGDEFQESYYRSDRSFQKEEALLYEDE